MAVSPFNTGDLGGGGSAPNASQGGAMPQAIGAVRGGGNDMFANKVPMAGAVAPSQISMNRTDRAISSQLPPQVQATPGE